MPSIEQVSPSSAMPPGAVTDPADWRGSAIGDADWLVHLDPADIAEIDASLKRIAALKLPLMSLTREHFAFLQLKQKLYAIKRRLVDGRGFAMLRGLPLDRYTREQAATAYWGISRFLGDPVPTNAHGHLISHVVSLGATFANPTQIATYSNDTFDYHTDECDVVGLLCLHPAKSGGASTLASAIAIHNEIHATRPDLLRVLYEPVHIDRRSVVPEGAKEWYRMPIFSWHAGKLAVWLQPGYTASGERHADVPRLSALQKEAMALVQRLAHDPKFRLDMDFRRGDMQFLNNHVVVHSRQSYEDHAEIERRRHLLRIMLVAPETRELSPWYAAPEARTPTTRGGVYLKGVEANIELFPERKPKVDAV